MNAVFDEKTELEYMMLRSYEENGLVARDLLLRVPFFALEQIEGDKWYTKIDENEKPKVRSIIQIDIISKIMMYIEDLAILSESLISQRNFYDLLDDHSIDIGKMVGKFFRRIDSISDKEICKIMSYGTSNQFNLDENSEKTLNKALTSNVKEIKRMLREIGDFDTANHTLFKRFKHAGMPIFAGSSPVTAGSGFLGG